MSIYRRTMLALPSAAPVGPLIYGLYNQVVADSDVIDTGVKPFANGSDCTILFDMTITTNPTNTAQAYQYVPLCAGNKSNFSVNKPSQWNNGLRASFCNSADNDKAAKILSSAAGRKRIVITHVGGTKIVRAIGKAGTGEPLEKTLTGLATYTLDENAVLTFGLTGTGYGLPPGTITKAEVYNTVLSQAEIDAFLA